MRPLDNATSVARALCLVAALGIIAASKPTGAWASEHTACASLRTDAHFKDTVIESAKAVPADAASGVPAFCEIVGTIEPVAKSRIGVVYRLPQAWNGKFLGLGGGGWAGNTRLDAAAPGLREGYATGQTNSGHDSPQGVWDTSWAANPEAITDFSDRAIHLMTTLGKDVVASYYKRPQSVAYFHGCSTGGRQGLMEVQRYPADYDGVIAGAPVYSLTTQTIALLRSQAFAHPGATVTEKQLAHLHEAVLAACDTLDGVEDGVVTDPRKCTFDPAKVQCGSGAAGDECLSAPQVSAVRAMYAGVKVSSGEFAAYPLTRGSEGGWSRFISTAEPATGRSLATTSAGAGLGGLRAAIFGDPQFDLAKFDAERDYRVVRNSPFARAYEAANPDISPFVQRGGKLLLWHGMDDPGPSPFATIDYFEAVQKTTGAKVRSLGSSARLFLAPGVYHCRGGPGPDQIDVLGALDKWVASGDAPDTLLATKADSPLSRPLCPYPALPRYKGTGDPNDAVNFSCAR